MQNFPQLMNQRTWNKQHTCFKESIDIILIVCMHIQCIQNNLQPKSSIKKSKHQLITFSLNQHLNNERPNS